MIPRSGGGGQEVNNRKGDEVFAEHGCFLRRSGGGNTASDRSQSPERRWDARGRRTQFPTDDPFHPRRAAGTCRRNRQCSSGYGLMSAQ